MLRQLRRACDALLGRGRFERDLRDEVRAHLDARTRDLVESGLSPTEASRQARVEFGALETYKEQCRDARGFAAFRPLHGLGADVRIGARRLAAAPVFTIFAALSLAVGIGVTTAVDSILYSLIWKPLGVADPARLMVLAAPSSAAMLRTYVSGPDFEDVRTALPSFGSVAAIAPFYEVLTTPDGSEAIEGEAVSGDYFQAIGVRTALGRALDANDDTTAARVAVLNDHVWRSQFHGDPDIVGQTVRLGGQAFEIVGVAPRTYDGIDPMPRRAGVWIPMRSLGTLGPSRTAVFESRTQRRLSVIGRLAPDRTRAAAATELAAAGWRLG